MRLIQALLCSILIFPVQAAPAHVHGVARIDLVVEGDKLTLSIDIPLDSATGFEHFPRTDKQKAALAESMKRLSQASDLFVPSSEAQCKVESVALGDPFPGGKAKASGHADVDVEYVFRCAHPAALKGLETTLFKRFSRLRRIDVQRATAGGQGASVLTAERPGLNW